MNTLSTWYRASRPFTLSGAIVPVLVGSGLAFRDGKASLLLFVLVLLGSVLVQVGANLVDEFSDHARPEGKQKLLAPYKVIALGLLSSRAVQTGYLVCFGLAAAIGLYLVWAAGWPVLAICLSSAAAAYFYSAGPKPLGAIGLGHPLVFLFMGPVMVLGTYYVQTQAFSRPSLWLSLPVGCTVTAILAANDIRDLEEDRGVGKVTPVTLLGRTFGRGEWELLLLTAFLIVIGLVAAGEIGPLALLSLLAVPEAISASQAIWRGKDRPALALGLRATSRFHLIFGLLLALGVALGRFI